MNEIIQTFGGAITSMVTHIGSAIKAVAETVMYDSVTVEGVTTQTLSTTATVLLTFAGVSLAIGMVVGFVRLIRHAN